MYRIDFDKPEHIHFIGIGGISMSGLAEVLLGAGFTVSGSDAGDSPLIARLRSLGADIAIGQKAENITPGIDAVVYTAAIHDNNPELRAAKEAGLPLLTRAELLGEVMDNYPVSVAVAGTHGKTTTTGMDAMIMLAGGLDPTVSVGGILPSIGGNIRVGKTENFLAEACEYTNSFLELRPRISVILNVDADHLDFFKDLDDIASSFNRFAKNTAPDGVLIVNRDTQKFSEIIKGVTCRILTTGLNSIADYMASDITFDDLGCATFTCTEFGETLGTFTLRVPGIHNVSNALSSIAMGRVLGLSPETIAQGLLGFSGVDRRFEIKGKMNGTTVIDDYAHHPTEIAATIRAAKAYPHRELWVIFQPHTYTRTKALLPEFAEALSHADHVILADIYAAREDDIYGISSKDVADAIAKLGTDAYYFDSFEKIEQFVRKSCVDNDLLITMGAGDVTNIGPALLS